MNVFWIIVCVIVIAAIAGLLPAILRARSRPRELEQNVLLRDVRIAELKRDVSDQIIDAQNLSSAEDEIARALLEESDPNSQTPERATSPATQLLLIASIVCGVPALAVFTYLELGEPQLATGPAAVEQADDAEIDQESIDQLVEQLRQRLADDPDSAEGWLLLGRTYMALNRFDEAVPALARAHELVGDVPQVLLQYADALAMADGGRIDADVRALVSRALALEPENVAALWLAGLGAAESGEREQALDYMRRAKTIQVRDGTPSTEVDAVIREFESAQGTAQPPANLAAEASVKVTVNIDPTLHSHIAEQDVLFVFVRAPNQSGPPLAVTRTQANSFPAEVVLDDTMAMAPMFKMKVGETVTVTARVAKSGTPSAQAGDMQGTSKPFVVGEVIAVAVVIDDVID